jgi:hypothetical protein
MDFLVEDDSELSVLDGSNQIRVFQIHEAERRRPELDNWQLIVAFDQAPTILLSQNSEKVIMFVMSSHYMLVVIVIPNNHFFGAIHLQGAF